MNFISQLQQPKASGLAKCYQWSKLYALITPQFKIEFTPEGNVRGFEGRLTAGVPYTKRTILEERNLHSKCFSVQQTCDAPEFARNVLRHRHRSFVKHSVLMSQSFRCSSCKFIAFKTTSRSLRCSDSFTSRVTFRNKILTHSNNIIYYMM